MKWQVLATSWLFLFLRLSTHPSPPLLMTLESLSYAAQVLEGTFPEEDSVLPSE